MSALGFIEPVEDVEGWVEAMGGWVGCGGFRQYRSWCKNTFEQWKDGRSHSGQWRISVGPQKSGLKLHEQKSEVAMLGSASGCLQSIEPLVILMNQFAGGLVL